MIRRLLPGAVISLLTAPTLKAQQPASWTMPGAALCAKDATAGSPAERTLLIASLLSDSSVSSVLRPMRPHDAARLSAFLHRGWADADTGRCGSFRTRASLRAWYNTIAAHPDRDGAVWQGRGATVSATAGIRIRRGVVSIALRPLGYLAENRSFEPPVPASAGDDFRDPLWGRSIDLPYRFGADYVASIDPGESHVRFDWRHIGLGMTTESQQWGPAHFYPLMLGTEGAGYPRVFGEVRKVPIGIGAATIHWHLGLLEASPYSRLPFGARSRIASALTASFRPAVFPSLELGGGRYFHVRRTAGALSFSTASLPLTGLLKTQSSDDAVGGLNQLATAFVRLAPAGAGIEIYGEFVRDDHSADLRDLIGEPDHSGGYTLGLRRAWIREGLLSSLTIEHGNGRISHLTRVRPQAPSYTHSTIAEGHTFRGQPLASSAMVAGGGTSVEWSRVSRFHSVAVSYEWRAKAQNSEGGTLSNEVSGVHLIRFHRAAAIHRRTYGIEVGARIPEGAAGGPGVIVALEMAR